MSSKSKYSPRRLAASSDDAPATKTLTTTRAFAFSNYSKAAQLPPGEALRSKTFDFHGRSWRIKLYPTGLSPATRDLVAVFVKCRTEPFGFYNAEVAVEILHKSGEAAVFDDATAKTTALTIGDDGFSKGYVRLASRRELEASSCVRDDDSFTVRCTLLINAHVVKPSVFPWRRTAKAKDDDAMVVTVTTPSLIERLLAPHSVVDTDAASTSTGVLSEVVIGSHTLTITGFAEKKASLACGECVRSAQFRVGGANWYIKVYPNGHDDGSKDSVSFFLARGRSGEPETTAEFAFELVNSGEAAGGNKKSDKARRTFNASNSEHLGFQHAAAALESSATQRRRERDRLVVRCKLGVFRGKPPCALLAEVPTITVPEDTRAQDFLRLLNSHEDSNITYFAGGTTFRAHTSILTARSRVFREHVRKLREDPEGNPWWQVEEEKVSAEAFEALLHVVYTDRLPDMSFVEPTEETVEAMVFTAEKFEVERLKDRTEEWLCTFMTPFTVADILSMAVRHDLRLLEAACVKYASPDHVWEHVKGTKGFDQLKATCPHIVRKIESKQRKY